MTPLHIEHMANVKSFLLFSCIQIMWVLYLQGLLLCLVSFNILSNALFSTARLFWVATESSCEMSQLGSHYWELPSHESQLDRDYSPLSNAPSGFHSVTYGDYFLLLIGLLRNWQQDREVRVRASKGLDMKWSLYMSLNQQNLTVGSIGLKSDHWVVKISLTTGLGSYPARALTLSSGPSKNKAGPIPRISVWSE